MYDKAGESGQNRCQLLGCDIGAIGERRSSLKNTQGSISCVGIAMCRVQYVMLPTDDPAVSLSREVGDALTGSGLERHEGVKGYSGLQRCYS